MYQQFRELASPMLVDSVVLNEEPNDPFKRKCQEQVPDSHGYPSALLSQKHMEKYYPIIVSVEARGITFPRWQRKQSAQMAAPHPAPTTEVSAGMEGGQSCSSLGREGLEKKMGIEPLSFSGCCTHPCGQTLIP